MNNIDKIRSEVAKELFALAELDYPRARRALKAVAAGQYDDSIAVQNSMNVSELADYILDLDAADL